MKVIAEIVGKHKCFSQQSDRMPRFRNNPRHDVECSGTVKKLMVKNDYFSNYFAAIILKYIVSDISFCNNPSK